MSDITPSASASNSGGSTASASELHLVRIVLDRRALLRVATRHRLGSRVDEGYLLHAGLSQLFAHSAAQAEVPFECFAADEQSDDPEADQRTTLLAYAHQSAANLQSQMGAARHELLLSCESKVMPSIREGTRVLLRTRVCPTVRTKNTPNEALRTNHKGRTISRELDVFLWKTIGVARDVEISREAVYSEWLASKLVADGACSVSNSMELVEFRRESVQRAGREGRTRAQVPSALMQGIVEVRHESAFRQTLARGVGRHRAFGFGMLLVRPA